MDNVVAELGVLLPGQPVGLIGGRVDRGVSPQGRREFGLADVVPFLSDLVAEGLLRRLPE